MKTKFPLALFLYFSLSTFVLLILGTWQLNKNYINKKNNLFIDESTKINPIIINNLGDNFKDLSYVNAKGLELNDKFLYLEPRTFKGKRGYHRLSVFEINKQYLLVNQGFFFSKSYNYSNKKVKNLEGYIIKIPKPKFFELKNDKNKKIWYSLNLKDIEEEFNLKLSKYILYQQKINTENRKSVTPNIVTNINHMNYALTWFFLSLTLCVIFYIYYKKNYRYYD